MKPGKPFAWGRLGDTPVLALPGNPASSWVSSLLFVKPLLERMTGGTGDLNPSWIICPTELAPAKRRRFLRVRNHAGTAEIHANQDSGSVSVLSWADGLMEVAPETSVTVGQSLPFYSFHGIASGTLGDAQWCASPHFSPRPAVPIDLVVLHNISLPPGQFGGSDIAALFQGNLDLAKHPWYAEHLVGVQVSAHFLIDRQGQVTQFVDTNDRAWHAGVSQFHGRQQCNDFSVGIELEGTDVEPFTTAQYQQLERLLRWLRQHHPVRFCCGHSDIAPGRKTDPGSGFDWSALDWPALELEVWRQQ